MYDWRRMTDAQRAEVLASRRMSGRPIHSPPHRADFGSRDYLITAACFEHRGIIGASPERLDGFCAALLATLSPSCDATHAWCVLPNHYHVLVDTGNVLGVLHALGRLHGRMSHAWNGEDRTRGRRVFFRATERAIRSESHWHAAMNYVHHNAVRHGYVARSTDWPWCSASEFVERVGREEAARLWREYPVMNFGGGWDDASM